MPIRVQHGFVRRTDDRSHGGHYQRLLEAIADNPDERIGTLPMLGNAERRQLLMEWNQTSTKPPPHPCVHQWFEAQAARTPQAVALRFEDQQCTYAD